MKVRILITAFAVCTALALPASAELVDNGNFARDLPYWRLFIHPGYVPRATVKRIPGGLEFNRLSPLTRYYLALSTAVNVKEGVKYTLSYEIKGPAKGTYIVRLGDRGDIDRDKKPSWHYFNNRLTVTGNWQTVEVPFTGKHDTKSNWYVKTRLARKNNRIGKDGQARAAREKAVIKVAPSDRPCVSTLDFFFGRLEGQVSIRNVSIKKVDKD